ncbi:MAG TPA: 1-deoxy-D-xylulose-5-phosphate reductoisomerase [Fusobacteriaceae bacterium]|nr:1-deoxy-D-xylulose-5-phosphate reductoisomerase [Fusobacteriaceae bacterium]
MKNITILGSTGSIGTSALEVIRNKSSEFNVVAMSAHYNHKLLIEQIEEFKPEYVSIGTKVGYEEIITKYPDLEVYLGNEGLKKLGGLDKADIVLTAVSGAVGIEATIESIKKEKRIALANKETMVAAGDLINNMLKEYKAEIIPVDSEHSAIYQSLLGGKKNEVNKIIITASGGTFRGKTLKELNNVKVEDALKHPNWSMGKKITVDSSTLCNKGLEVIEAHQLFNVSYDNIEVLVHPQSIIHSMVEFNDMSIIAQLGVPDMKVPIQYAFTYPNRISNNVLKSLDFKTISNLTFDQVDNDVFKGVEYAYFAGRVGQSMPAVYNAANEIAVDEFINGNIKFLDIYRVIKDTMDKHIVHSVDSLEKVIKADTWARKEALRIIKTF